ncbi:M28 family metallopeptidase [Pseudofulvimonas gallinarii]|jgi:Zn-dependent M28 family amino/carboxypeptidase|uniref:Zn-dependent M28 family amino/carboxypeptidase n=1 Tax=Pseudofulvimonas gallinarii TaxID=634155 RepID=A0A4R3LBK3_9GAMM|nr:M28 family metallopeptidase [Pseudofulvimonas gallinarii]TCS97169.1 Zn-dependent M28 family amino/carboxypeptidase [Pseudofulvimonas gallinarii]THD12554.1 aminopeptidase [Pseudofulvimonas gallinarii]
MRHPLIAAAIAAALLAGCQREAAPPQTAAPAPATPAATGDEASGSSHTFSQKITAEDFAEHVRTLSSDAFEGRGPGTNGERRTTAYLAEQLKRIGAKPGNGDSYFQPVPMVEITGSPETTLTFSFADSSTQTLAYGDDMVVGSRRTIPEASIANSEVVFVGYGINAPELGWNDYDGLDVAGKTVVVLVNDPDYDAAEGADMLFRGRAMTYYGRWTYKYEEAARQGAAAALLVHDTVPAAYGWDVVRNSWSGPQYDLPSSEDGSPKLMIEGWVTNDAAQALMSKAGQDLAALSAKAKQKGFTAVPLEGVTASSSIRNQIREATSNNVVGIIEGSERPDEYVLYMGHWDHLGRSFSAPGGDGIYNGAIDNATGVAGVLEIGEAFAASPPKRSVILLLVTLEESGLLGSRYYTEHPLFPLHKTAAVINLDAMSVIGPARDMTVVGFGNSSLDDLLVEALKPSQREARAEPTPENGFYFRSDHFNFAKKGVPALYAKGGPDHVEKGVEYGHAQAADYGQHRYHKPADEFDPSWDLRGVVEDLDVLFNVGNVIASGEDWPQWRPTSEFRAAGDGLAAQRQ